MAEILSSITEIAKAFAWPATVFLTVIILRSTLTGLVRDVRLRKAEFPGPFTVEFEQEIINAQGLQQQVKATSRFQTGEDVSNQRTEADRLLRQAGLHPSPSRFNLETYYDMGNADPAAALVALRGEIQAMINSILDFRNIQWLGRDTAERKLLRLYDDRAINNHQYTLARSIIRLSNAAARDNSVTHDQAIDVLYAAQPLIQEYMSWILKDLGLQTKIISQERKRESGKKSG